MGIRSLVVSFERAQRAQARSPHTVKLYRDCLTRLVRFLEAESESDGPSGLTRRLLTDYYATRMACVAASTVSIDFRVHRVFLRWCVDEGEIAASPMDRMRQPRVPVTPVPTLADDEIRALLGACEGTHIRDRRDMALLRLLLDCGLRRTELASLRLTDLDLASQLVTVTGKGKTRQISFGAKSALALDRWLRARDKAVVGGDQRLWLSLTPNGVYQALRGRAQAAGVSGWHTHRMRHDFAHRWLVARGNEGDLMEVAGWSSSAMLRRYGASAAAERAHPSMSASRFPIRRPGRVACGCHPSRGQALVEFSIVLVVFLELFLALFDLGRVVYAQNTITQAARDASRLGAVSPSYTQAKYDNIRNQALRSAIGVSITGANVTGQAGGACPSGAADPSGTCFYPIAITAGSPVVVNIVVTVPLITPIVAQLVGGSITLRAASEGMIQCSGC